MDNEQALTVVAESSVVVPSVSADQALKMWQAYEELKAKLATPKDVQQIKGNDFLKKSYWRKIKTFFSLDVTLVSEDEKPMLALIRINNQGTDKEWRQVEYYPIGTDLPLADNEMVKTTMIFSAVYRAHHPNGRVMDGDGHCDLWEKGYPNSYHNAKATAHTRAKNRAISDLVGGGEVSAEEVVGYGQPDTAVPNHYEDKPKSKSGGGKKDYVITEKQRGLVWARAANVWPDKEECQRELKGIFRGRYKIEKTEEMTKTQLDDFLDYIDRVKMASQEEMPYE